MFYNTQHFVIVQTLAGIHGKPNMPGFLLDVSQFHISIVMIIVASRSLRYLLALIIFKDSSEHTEHSQGSGRASLH